MASRNVGRPVTSSRPNAKQAVGTKMTSVLYSYIEGETVIAIVTNGTSMHELDSSYKLFQLMRLSSSKLTIYNRVGVHRMFTRQLTSQKKHSLLLNYSHSIPVQPA
jgi:hypothetical protein